MSWKSAVRENHAAIAAMSDPELREILPVLIRLRREIAQKFVKFFQDSGEQETYTIKKHASLLGQLDEAIQSAREELGIAAKHDLASGVTKAAKTGSSNMIKMVVAGAKKHGGPVPTLKLPIARILLSTKSMAIHRHTSSIARYAGSVGLSIQRAMALGVMRGESIDQIAKRLVGAGHKTMSPTTKGKVVAQNNFFRNKADATRLVRTELVNAYNYSQDRALYELNHEDPGWLMIWDAMHDKRRCEDCRAMDGKVATPGGTFPGGVRHPPLHPNDRCAIRPHRKEWTK